MGKFQTCELHERELTGAVGLREGRELVEQQQPDGFQVTLGTSAVQLLLAALACSLPTPHRLRLPRTTTCGSFTLSCAGALCGGFLALRKPRFGCLGALLRRSPKHSLTAVPNISATQ